MRRCVVLSLRVACSSPSRDESQQTYVGHAWRIPEGTKVLGLAAAVGNPARLDVR